MNTFAKFGNDQFTPFPSRDSWKCQSKFFFFFFSGSPVRHERLYQFVRSIVQNLWLGVRQCLSHDNTASDELHGAASPKTRIWRERRNDCSLDITSEPNLSIFSTTHHISVLKLKIFMPKTNVCLLWGWITLSLRASNIHETAKLSGFCNNSLTLTLTRRGIFVT